jgi:phosphate transport system substrate-binding protein
VKVVPLAKEAKGTPVPATAENASNYPLARFLWLTVNYRPGSKLDSLRGEFIRYVFSKQGQAVVIEDGYLPLPAKLAERELKKVGL